MKIPDALYERVFDLATGMTYASESGDTKSFWRLYDELRVYCEAQSDPHRDHPFLWETLADFTTDDRIAIDLYLKALRKAEQLGAADYEASIGLAIAERYPEAGNATLASRYASSANERAKSLDDLELRRRISQFLLDQSEANRPRVLK